MILLVDPIAQPATRVYSLWGTLTLNRVVLDMPKHHPDAYIP